jgi:hypothetical protein
MDQRPEFLALGPAFVLSGIGLVGTRGALWASVFDLPAMALFVIAGVLQIESLGNPSKNGNERG